MNLSPPPKTHAIIALVAAARAVANVTNAQRIDERTWWVRRPIMLRLGSGKTWLEGFPLEKTRPFRPNQFERQPLLNQGRLHVGVRAHLKPGEGELRPQILRAEMPPV